MVVIRPIREQDLDALVALAMQGQFGLTSLPKDRERLADRITESTQGFAKIAKKPRGESYLFVMEDLDTREVVGVCGIVSKVGGFEPFYAYRVESIVHESKELHIRKEVPTLHLVAEHNGPCEIGSLFLAPSHRGGGRGRLLSLSRFLFMADHPEHFDDVVIAELRGVIDDQGRSPFWDAIGRHFFDMDYPTADYLSFVNKRFIADLMPKHPIYLPLLPAEAQAVVGQVHEHTKPARRMLETEGFTFSGMVDIFEAGPVVSSPRTQIRSVKESVVKPLAEIVDRPIESEPCVIGNCRREFRACAGPVETAGDQGVGLRRDVAAALSLNVGDNLRLVTMRPRE
jgi:arginine N-succinyltransferase